MFCIKRNYDDEKQLGKAHAQQQRPSRAESGKKKKKEQSAFCIWELPTHGFNQWWIQGWLNLRVGKPRPHRKACVTAMLYNGRERPWVWCPRGPGAAFHIYQGVTIHMYSRRHIILLFCCFIQRLHGMDCFATCFFILPTFRKATHVSSSRPTSFSLHHSFKRLHSIS